MGKVMNDAQVSSLGTLAHKAEEPRKKQSQVYPIRDKL